MWIVIRPLIPADWLSSLQVVVVEDRDPLRGSILRLLELEGASVRAFPSAEEARDALEDGTCDLLLSDVCMPGMGGRGLFEWVESSRQDLLAKMVFMTGDRSDEVRSFVSSTGRPLLPKPFEPMVLLDVLYDVYRDR